MRRIWVIEMLMDNGKWEPTVGTALNRSDARLGLRIWRKQLPSDRLRIRRYGRSKEKT